MCVYGSSTQVWISDVRGCLNARGVRARVRACAHENAVAHE